MAAQVRRPIGGRVQSVATRLVVAKERDRAGARGAGAEQSFWPLHVGRPDDLHGARGAWTAHHRNNRLQRRLGASVKQVTIWTRRRAYAQALEGAGLGGSVT